jgi:hypothetical protein
MSNDYRNFAAASAAKPSRHAYCWGPSLPALSRLTSATTSAADPASWERPLTTRSIQIDSNTCVAVSMVGEHLDQEDMLRALEAAMDQVRAQMQPRARLAA